MIRTPSRKPSCAFCQTRNGLLIGALGLLTGVPGAVWAGAPAKIKRAPESTLNQLILTPQASERIGIRIGPITKERVPQTITVGGLVVPRPGTAARLRAPFSGTVEVSTSQDALPVPGTRVQRGQTILRLRPLVAPNRNLLAETRRDRDQARARFETAKKASARANTLLADGAGDRAAVELAQQDLSVARAELAAAQERFRRAQRDPLGADVSLPLRAPRTGVVLALFAAEGQTVDQGAPLVEVVSPDALWVRVPLYIGRLSRIDVAASASIRPLGGGDAIDASAVTSIPIPSNSGSAPGTTAAAGTVADLLYSLPPGTLFTPGTRVFAKLAVSGTSEPRTIVPTTAVFYDHHGAAWLYAVVGENTYERRRIEVATVVGSRAVLSRGPDVDTSIVTVGAMELFGTEFGIGK